jgi:hypothetical protein
MSFLLSVVVALTLSHFLSLSLSHDFLRHFSVNFFFGFIFAWERTLRIKSFLNYIFCTRKLEVYWLLSTGQVSILFFSRLSISISPSFSFNKIKSLFATLENFCNFWWTQKCAFVGEKYFHKNFSIKFLSSWQNIFLMKKVFIVYTFL